MIFTGLLGGAGHGAAANTLAGPGVSEHLHRVIGVRSQRVQHRAECMTDFRLPTGLRLGGGTARRLVQQLVSLHDPVNFVGRRWFPGHLDVLTSQSGASYILRWRTWNYVKSYRVNRCSAAVLISSCREKKKKKKKKDEMIREFTLLMQYTVRLSLLSTLRLKYAVPRRTNIA